MLKLQIALFFADGRAYFAGIGLMLLAVAASIHMRSRGAARLSRLAAVFGMILIALSSTPLSPWFYAFWLVVTIAWLVEGSYRLARLPHWTAPVLVLTTCAAAAAIEFPRRALPAIRTTIPACVYVIGDSLSAGMGRNEWTWPTALHDPGRIEVIDLSRAGATVRSAIAQARQVQPGPAVVLLEIGGNDLLGTTSVSEYAKALRQLLDVLSAPSRQLVMFELPLPPFSNGYGGVQRSLAEEYNVPLIPKRVLAGVIGSSDTTLDGLHLSDAGHRRIAEAIRGILGGKSSSSASSP